MSKSEQMVKIRKLLIKKRDEVFETRRLSDEAKLALSGRDIESEETAKKKAIDDLI
jgi:hypothetical protein